MHDQRRASRAPARARQPVASASATTYEKARLASDKAQKGMLNQTDTRRSSKKRDADLALQKEAAADANETVAVLESVAEVSRDHFEALQIQMQDMKRQKTVDDFALLTAT